MTARVRLVGKPGCHLCDQAREVIRGICDDLGEPWDEASILEDPVLADLYWEQIPVTLVDGEVVGIWHVEAAALRAALARRA